jgi:MFS family permease
MLGVGAVSGVALYPRLRQSMSGNAVLALSAVTYAVGVVSVAYLPAGAAVPLLLLSGAAWIATLTTLNAAIQLSLAHWVRARGMSIYLLVFMGSQALGSFVWGLVASHVGFAAALLISAVLLVVTAASVTVLPLRADTGTLPRGVSTAWPTPMVMFEPEPDDGPVVVSVTYRVRPDSTTDFDRAMAAVGKARRRTGGYSWALFRNGEDPSLRVEQFTARSWGDLERQHRERWTESDHQRMTEALSYTVTGTTEKEEHLFGVPADR